MHSEERHVRIACARDALDSHQRGIPTNECAVERKNILDGRAAIFESSTGMETSQLGRNKTYLNTATPSGFSIGTLLGQKGLWNVFDRFIDGRVRNGSCSDKFVVTNCIENATSNRRSDQEVLVDPLIDNSLLSTKFKTARKLKGERVGLSVKVVCNLSSKVIVGGGAVH